MNATPSLSPLARTLRVAATSLALSASVFAFSASVFALSAGVAGAAESTATAGTQATNLPAPVGIVVFSRGDADPKPLETDGLTSASVMPDRSTGTTRFAAEALARLTGGEIVPLVPAEPYPRDFQETVARSHAGTLPRLAPLPDLTRFRTLVVAGPNWGMTASGPVKSFLQTVAPQLAPEVVIPLVTHTVYGPGRAAQETAAAFPNARVLPVIHFEDRAMHAHPESVSGEIARALNLPDATKADTAEVQQAVAPQSAEGVELVASYEIEGETRELRVVLNDTVEAQRFLKLLPISVRMGEFGDREYYGGNTELETEGPGRYDFEEGMLTYCPTNDSFAFFYNRSTRPNLTMAVYPLGMVVTPLEVFRTLPGSVEFTFRRAEDGTSGK